MFLVVRCQRGCGPAQVLEKIDEADDGGIERTRLRATKALTGLGFTPELLARKTSELSGGWRMRVSTMIVTGSRCSVTLSKDWMILLAGGACEGAVHAAGRAHARRAHQPPRPAGGSVIVLNLLYNVL